jgi:hypothetical protein
MAMNRGDLAHRTKGLRAARAGGEVVGTFYILNLEKLVDASSS